MSKLNKTQTYAISWLNYIGNDIDDIATELELTTKQVLSVIEKTQTTKSKEDLDPIKTASKSAAKKIVSKNLMVNQTASKKTKNVMIMTPEASMHHDEMRKKTTTINKNQQHIFRPNSNK